MALQLGSSGMYARYTDLTAFKLSVDGGSSSILHLSRDAAAPGTPRWLGAMLERAKWSFQPREAGTLTVRPQTEVARKLQFG